jgi:hypothetical protein
MQSERLLRAREGISQVLSGARTPESTPRYFEEDLFQFDLYFLEQEDSSWLEEQVARGPFTLERRLAVAINVFSEFRHQLLRPLLEELVMSQGASKAA